MTHKRMSQEESYSCRCSMTSLAMREVKAFRVSSLSSAAEQRRFAMTSVYWSSENSSRWQRKDEDRQEEELAEKGTVQSKRVRHGWNEDDCECAQNLSQEMCGVITTVEQRCVQSQCMYVARPLKCRCIVSTLSLVSCLVSCLFRIYFT